MTTTNIKVTRAIVEVLRETAPATSVDGKAVLTWLRKNGENATAADVEFTFQWIQNLGCATAFEAKGFGDEVGVSLTDIDTDCLNRFHGS
jgi:hypothetical protein